jgi:hypothetical protein
MMAQHNRNTDDESKKAVEEFLANGGKITYCNPMERTENIEFKGGFYTKRKKKKEEQEKEKE